MHAIHLSGSHYSQYLGLSSGIVAVLLCAQPLISAAIAARWMSESLAPRQWLGVAAGLAGVILIVWHKIDVREASAGALIAVTFALFPYQLRRFDAWINQNSYDKELEKIVLQVRFAKRAVSTGGLFGKGYLDGPLTNGKYIPVQFTDFPFSAIGEQFGAIGGAVVLVLFGVVLWRVWRIAQMARDRFGYFLVTGIFTILMWQVFQNIGMSMGVTPVSGLPLDRKSTRLNSSHVALSRMPSSA